MRSINAQYDRMIKSHPKETRDAILFMEDQMRSADCKFGEELVPTFLKPFFLHQKHVDEFTGILTHVMSILEKVTRLFFTDPQLRDYFYINEEAAKVLEVEHRYPKNILISRPDAFWVDDVLRFVEFNCDSPAGSGYCDVEEEIFYKTFLMERLSKDYEFPFMRRTSYLLEALLSAYRQSGGDKARPNIVIVDWKEVRTQNEFQIIKRNFERKGYKTEIADPRELKLQRGHLVYKDFSIDIVYRRVIFKELMDHLSLVKDFIEADRKGKVCVVNPLRSKLASNKATLAIITNQKEFKHLFTDEENQVIQRHIPWTRRVVDMETHYEDNLIFLRKHIVSHQKTLVLKPSDSYGGKDVVIGRETGKEDWGNLVSRIIRDREDWVVQKFVEIPEMTVPQLNNGKVKMSKKKVNLNPFVYNGRYAGSMARLSEQSVINVSAGGGLIPVVSYAELN